MNLFAKILVFPNFKLQELDIFIIQTQHKDVETPQSYEFIIYKHHQLSWDEFESLKTFHEIETFGKVFSRKTRQEILLFHVFCHFERQRHEL